tara:strand:- start:881 stop:1123 length:243 start_codon:yes stop_codon:yes gene_type:complete
VSADIDRHAKTMSNFFYGNFLAVDDIGPATGAEPLKHRTILKNFIRHYLSTDTGKKPKAWNCFAATIDIRRGRITELRRA